MIIIGRIVIKNAADYVREIESKKLKPSGEVLASACYCSDFRLYI